MCFQPAKGHENFYATQTTGIAGGAGDDETYNHTDGKLKAYSNAEAYAELASVNVQGKATGIVIGGAIALADSTATSTATGIDGGTGKDTLLNAAATANSIALSVAVQGVVKGFGGQAAVTDTNATSTATAVGLSGGSDEDTVTNDTRAILKSYATANTTAGSISVDVQGSQTGGTLAGSLARGETTPTATATGLSGEAGDDTLANDGFLDVQAATDSTSVAVSVGIAGLVEGLSVGASFTDTSTMATATATGIDGGADNDTLFNYRSITTKTDSQLRAASVSVNSTLFPIGLSAGAALSIASTDATGKATGMEGGMGDDTLVNAAFAFIDTDALASSTSTSVSISANVLGAAWTDTSATTLTQATGMSGGIGKDMLVNWGDIDSYAKADAYVTDVDVNIGLGAMAMNGNTSAEAQAVGLNGGTGDDWVQNEGTLRATSDAHTDATEAGVELVGYSDAELIAKAVTGATGLQGESGIDTMTNRGVMTLIAHSISDGWVGIGSLVGYGETDVSVIATATAIGLDGGTGNDTLTNENEITASSTAEATGGSVTVEVLGAGFAAADTTAQSYAIGLAGGAGNDTVTNRGTITLSASAAVDATSVAVSLLGYADSEAKMLSEVILTGMDGGAGDDVLLNDTGSSIFTTRSTVATPAAVIPTATADTVSVSVDLLGGANVDGSSTTSASAYGMAGGTGNDKLLNRGTIDIGVASDNIGHSGGGTLAGYGEADVSVTSIATAIGLAGGAGDDTLKNAGSITGYSNARAQGFSVGVQILGAGFADTTTTARAFSTGLSGDAGSDTIKNSGTITLTALSDVDQTNVSVTLGGDADTDGTGVSQATITGLAGGEGNDRLINTTTGVMTGTATATAKTDSVPVSLLGAANADATLTASAYAYCISGGAGADDLMNLGIIDIATHVTSDGDSVGVTLVGYMKRPMLASRQRPWQPV